MRVVVLGRVTDELTCVAPLPPPPQQPLGFEPATCRVGTMGNDMGASGLTLRGGLAHGNHDVEHLAVAVIVAVRVEQL